MANRGNIVSFEDVRRSRRNTSSAASPSERRGKNASASRKPRAPEQSSEWAMYGSAASKPSRSKAKRSSDKPHAKAAPAKASKAEVRERRKRQKTKERADRQFTRQYAASSENDIPTEGAPRAALYKGKMGASQRKSTRMQRASQAESVTAKLNPAGWFSHLNLSSRTAKVVTTVICAVFVCAFLYTPAQQYYQAQRENARLTAEYEAVASRNTALDEHNDSLASDAGLEDAVRQKYGYIVAGEQTAIVTGLSDEVELSKKSNAQVEANVLASSVKAPEEWFTPILDTVFGVE